MSSFYSTGCQRDFLVLQKTKIKLNCPVHTNSSIQLQVHSKWSWGWHFISEFVGFTFLFLRRWTHCSFTASAFDSSAVSLDWSIKRKRKDINVFLPSRCNFSSDIQYQPQLSRTTLCSAQARISVCAANATVLQPRIGTADFQKSVCTISLYLPLIWTISVIRNLQHTATDAPISFFRFKSIVGIGVGAGAYILAKLAVSHISVFRYYIIHIEHWCVLCGNFCRGVLPLNPRWVSHIFLCPLLSADLPWHGGGFGSAQHRPQW